MSDNREMIKVILKGQALGNMRNICIVTVVTNIHTHANKDGVQRHL